MRQCNFCLIWGENPDKVRVSIIVDSVKDRGLDIIHISTFIKSLSYVIMLIALVKFPLISP